MNNLTLIWRSWTEQYSGGLLLEYKQLDPLLEDQLPDTYWKIINCTYFPRNNNRTSIGRALPWPSTGGPRTGHLLEDHQLDQLLEDQEQNTNWKINNWNIFWMTNNITFGRSSTQPSTWGPTTGHLLEGHQLDHLPEEQQPITYWKIINSTIYWWTNNTKNYWKINGTFYRRINNLTPIGGSSTGPTTSRGIATERLLKDHRLDHPMDQLQDTY